MLVFQIAVSSRFVVYLTQGILMAKDGGNCLVPACPFCILGAMSRH